MKRYLVFYGSNYYPCGGMEDFIGEFETEFEAKKALNIYHSKNTLEDKEWDWNWFHIWDSELKQIVDQSER